MCKSYPDEPHNLFKIVHTSVGKYRRGAIMRLVGLGFCNVNNYGGNQNRDVKVLIKKKVLVLNGRVLRFYYQQPK